MTRVQADGEAPLGVQVPSFREGLSDDLVLRRPDGLLVASAAGQSGWEGGIFKSNYGANLLLKNTLTPLLGEL